MSREWGVGSAVATQITTTLRVSARLSSRAPPPTGELKGQHGSVHADVMDCSNPDGDRIQSGRPERQRDETTWLGDHSDVGEISALPGCPASGRWPLLQEEAPKVDVEVLKNALIIVVGRST